MPTHWYYDRNALDRDYGDFDDYLPPRSPHPDSILWRSTYDPIGPKADILKEQAKYWGQRGVHYHQFLQAGENTLNLKLSVELYRWIILRGEFNLNAWLRRYAQVMLTPTGTMIPMPRNTTVSSSPIMREEKPWIPAGQKICTSVPLA